MKYILNIKSGMAISVISIIIFLIWLDCLLSLSLQPEEVKINEVTESSAVITWKTKNETSGQLVYGEAVQELRNVQVDINNGRDHKIALSSLKKGTVYYFQILFPGDEQKYSIKSYHFKTKGIPEPKLLDYKINKITKKSCDLEFRLNTPCRVKVKYRTDRVKEKELCNNTFQTSVFLTLNGLISDSVYSCSLELRNQDNETVIFPLDPFSTPINNLALLAEITGTFRYLPDDPFIIRDNNSIQRITDGKKDYFSGMVNSGNIRLQDQYLIMDLKKVHLINKILIYWWAYAYSEDYSIWSSMDNKTWQLVKDRINGNNGESIKGEREIDIKLNKITFPGKKMRYIKLVLIKNSAFYVKLNIMKAVSLLEIEAGN